MSDQNAPAPDEETTPRPFLRVVSGNPTDEDIAVLTVVLAAASAQGGEAPADTGPRNDWGRPADLLRPEWQGGPAGFIYGNP